MRSSARTGTHRARLPALQQEFNGIPASGQTVRVEGMNFYRLKDGRVTDVWTQFDGVALMQQLGAIPA
jgi:predicted ester cyclase